MHQPSSWRRIPLWIQGIVLNSLPLIAVLLSAGFAFVSNQRREKMEMSLTRHFEMVENLVNVQTTLLEAEAALRGRLLTRRADFRAPYEAARESIPKTMAHIRTIMERKFLNLRIRQRCFKALIASALRGSCQAFS
jgi:CHASE3 domain sensor protein